MPRRVTVRLCIASLAAAGLLIGCGSSPGTSPAQDVPQALRDFCRDASKVLSPEPVGVPGAGTAIGGGRNHLVALSTSGNESLWEGSLPDDWRPATLADTEFVACGSDNMPDEFETCTYLPSGKVTRVRFLTYVSVYEAATGRKVSIEGAPALMLRGTDPPPCPEQNPPSTRLEGERIAWAAVQPRLESLIAGEAVGTVTLTLTGGPYAGSYSLLDPFCSLGRVGPGVWQLEALDKNTRDGLSYFMFKGSDDLGSADLRIRFGRYDPLSTDTYRVTVPGDAGATPGEGAFSVDVQGDTAKFTGTGRDSSGVGIAWTVFCPRYS